MKRLGLRSIRPVQATSSPGCRGQSKAIDRSATPDFNPQAGESPWAVYLCGQALYIATNKW
jgi:hypothetical protein